MDKTEGRKKKVILINPPRNELFPFIDTESQPYGLLKIGGLFLRKGYDVKMIDCGGNEYDQVPLKTIRCGIYRTKEFTKPVYHLGKSYEELQKELETAGEPDEIWVTSSFTYYWESVHKTIEVCKQVYPKAKVVLGGLYATLCPEHAAKSKADLILPGRYREADLSPTALELLPKRPLHAIIKYTRGCPNNCSYCAVTKLEGHKMEYMNEELFVWELEDKFYNHGIFFFDLWESNLLVRANDHFEKVLDTIIERRLPIQILLPEGLQTNLIYERLAKKMKLAGVVGFALPLESSDEKLCSERFHRPSSLNDFERAVRTLKKAGFQPPQMKIFILIGMPKQSISSMVRSCIKTLWLNCRVICLAFTPIPGTEEYKNYGPLVGHKGLEELHPRLWPFANEEMEVEDLENLTKLNKTESFYDLVGRKRNRIIDMIFEEIKGSILKTSLPEIDDLKFTSNNVILDFTITKEDVSPENRKMNLARIKKLRKSASENNVNLYFLTPLPYCIKDAEDTLTPSGCAGCLKTEMRPEPCEYKQTIMNETPEFCKSCIYWMRGVCNIRCLK
ncbi:radical SAM protein [Candidatus Woesearchaeota archaeon]|nr:radical SAM protein [Candidatus Woesearchaeota archaeon]